MRAWCDVIWSYVAIGQILTSALILNFSVSMYNLWLKDKDHRTVKRATKALRWGGRAARDQIKVLLIMRTITKKETNNNKR